MKGTKQAWLYTNGQSRFIPPVLNKERSNIENSENTALFLVSCFQYILSAIVLSVGPPFRQTMADNRKSAHHPTKWPAFDMWSVPFVVTIVVAVLFSSYMLFDPAAWLANLMQLTEMTAGFKTFIIVLATGGFACAWTAERRAFVWLARVVGKIHDLVWPHRRRRRKQYKALVESMRI